MWTLWHTCSLAGQCSPCLSQCTWAHLVCPGCTLTCFYLPDVCILSWSKRKSLYPNQLVKKAFNYDGLLLSSFAFCIAGPVPAWWSAGPLIFQGCQGHFPISAVPSWLVTAMQHLCCPTQKCSTTVWPRRWATEDVHPLYNLMSVTAWRPGLATHQIFLWVLSVLCPPDNSQSVRLHAARNSNFWSYRIMTCVGLDHLSEYTCRSENRITDRSMADSVTLGGAVALSTKSQIRLTSIYFCNLFEKIRVSRLSAVHKPKYIQLLHLGQHEPGLLVRPEVRRCWSHGVDWLTFSGNNTTI